MDMLHCSPNSVVCKGVLVVASTAPVIFNTEEPTQSTGLYQDTVITLYLCRICLVQDRGGGWQGRGGILAYQGGRWTGSGRTRRTSSEPS